MATRTQDIFSKLKRPPRPEAEGSEIVEVREDSEQSVKLQEIVDLLVAAGYFRARIKGLSPFDKIVGGMTWCIESCNVDIDVDLLFRENSTIGQKIALTERIVAVLPKMKCPHRIEPHQIQGMDCINIFPIVQWLVKRSMEFRQEMKEFVRSYAINSFEKDFRVKSARAEAEQSVLRNVKLIKEAYRPVRCFRRVNTSGEKLETNVQLTLLEYGQKGVGSLRMGKTNENEELAGLDQDDLGGRLEALDEELEEGLEELSQEDLKALREHYSSLHLELRGGDEEAERLKELVREKLELEKAFGETQRKHDSLVEETQGLREELEETKAQYKELQERLEELEEEIGESPEDLGEIEELVQSLTELQKKEKQFREECKEEYKRLQKEIEEAKVEAEKPNMQLYIDTEAVRKLRIDVADKNRSIANLQRTLDEVPGRAELAQYQRRFLELYNQVVVKHKETKQYYTLYNTLEDTRAYIRKELSLLNSVSDNYSEAMQSSAGKEEYINQMVTILEGVKQSKCKLERKLQESKSNKDKLNGVLHGLVEQQRRYVAAIKELCNECKRHESLQNGSKR